ncbi:Calmodulin-binding transcription activator protein with CG-1 and Ankyrin domains, putative isoform 2 [Hibiscus syriacus]|uniref:Calmodulin-binding transcription activator protein with CG-1 and Ankyrin domains, putative isoform 2 n=1 Tax=Hibiscus syriacus TaxID=106335 RepID=A0A6A3BX65_HIBSY|nr:Calmodulin-binding transcription activator protein with CG-1 and Ankyrin domains, putative isoform 2 [Hibiscus syriacus]
MIESVDVLHCYYAHGQFNENFQRRCYWMLDGEFEHIAFVHYREVKEGYRSGTSRLLPDPGSRSESLQTGSASSLAQQNSAAATIEISPASTSRVDWKGKTLSSEFEDVDSRDYPSADSPDRTVYGSISCSASVEPEVAGFWPGIHNLATNTISMPDQKLYIEQPATVDFKTHREVQLRVHDISDAVTCGDKLINNVGVQAVGEYPGKLIQELQQYDSNLIGVGTKVLLVGNFLRNKKLPDAAKWGCMFGEIEVSAEVLTNNVIRCQVPSHAPGRVPFYITCSNRLACNEINPPGFSFITAVKSTAQEEMHLQVRLAKLLHVGPRRKREWLINKVHEDGKGQGVIHLAASLGYEWAMDLIVAAGISPNFRDARGRTALHWASYFGREETVIVLIKLGASRGGVDDPTPSIPGGRTAADLASGRGHKGIAGYIAEADLITRLSSLTVNQNVVDNDAATMAAQAAVETASKSAQAAALIQAVFHALLSHFQSTKGNDDMSEVSLELGILGSWNRHQKMSNFGDYLHTAASKIQHKYRGRKGMNEFLKLRNRIVKIQARVRGHQVRKQYKKLLWSVCIVEKIILLWRRKGSGLLGFRMRTAIENAASDTDAGNEYEFLKVGQQQKVDGIGKALARVKSMARDQEALLKEEAMIATISIDSQIKALALAQAAVALHLINENYAAFHSKMQMTIPLLSSRTTFQVLFPFGLPSKHQGQNARQLVHVLTKNLPSKSYIYDATGSWN